MPNEVDPKKDPHRTILPKRDGEVDTILPDDFATDIASDTAQPGRGQADRAQIDQAQADQAQADRAQIAARPSRYDALRQGDQIGDFRILRLLGRGSFGAVYLARELMLDRLVALKVVLPEGRKASVGEGRNLARLKHPGIVGVYGEAQHQESGCSLLWMQFVDGANLADLIKQSREDALDNSTGEHSRELLRLLQCGESNEHRAECICRFGQRLAEAVSHAHRCGVAHRDIKPANILVQSDGMPLLADFNLSSNEHDGSKTKSGGNDRLHAA